jgi:hypothetical protein
MGLIGISGHIGSGKDLTGKIIQYLLEPEVTENDYKNCTDAEILALLSNEPLSTNTWKIKKFADKLKDCVCLITNCSREDLENSDVKNALIPGYGGVWLTYTDKYQDTPYDPKWFKSEEEAEAFLNNENCVYWHDITPATLTFRQLLQRLGTDVGRIIHPDIWVNALMSEYSRYKYVFNPGYYQCRCSICGEKFMADKRQPVCEPCCNKVFYPNWIITDMRFPNELKAVKDREGITIRVNRTFDIRVQHSGNSDDYTIVKFDPTNPAHVDLMHGEYVIKHASETALDNATFDYTIENNGTIKELVEKVREILIKEKML